MGLTNWKQAPGGKILKSDVSIAKNYLNKTHIDELNQVVSGYLDLAELRAKRQIVTNMDEWVVLLNDFLKLAQYPILRDKGKMALSQNEWVIYYFFVRLRCSRSLIMINCHAFHTWLLMLNSFHASLYELRRTRSLF